MNKPRQEIFHAIALGMTYNGSMQLTASDATHILAPSITITGGYTPITNSTPVPALTDAALVAFGGTLLNYDNNAAPVPAPPPPCPPCPPPPPCPPAFVPELSKAATQTLLGIATTQETTELLSVFFPLLVSNQLFGAILTSTSFETQFADNGSTILGLTLRQVDASISDGTITYAQISALIEADQLTLDQLDGLILSGQITSGQVQTFINRKKAPVRRFSAFIRQNEVK